MEEASKNSGGDAHQAPSREAVQTIPIIDISPFVTGGEHAARQQLALELRKACINVGFFYLVGHGIPEQELNEAINWSHKFFELPIDVKMRFRSTAAAEAGFVRVGGINAEANTDKVSDLKERFVLARELSATASPDGISSKSLSRWPTDDVVPGFRRFMTAHLAKRIGLSRHLIQAFALSLRLPETYFDEFFREMAFVSLINYYPPLDEETVKTNRWSFSPHTDYGAFTLLSQDDLGGLQVRNSIGDWIEVPPIRNTFVVNIGDLMAMWTNDLYTSNLHRAANVSGVARISIPFFASPNGGALIRCIETCAGADNQPKYEPVTAGEYVRSLIARGDAAGKPSLSAKTAGRLNESRTSA